MARRRRSKKSSDTFGCALLLFVVLAALSSCGKSGKTNTKLPEIKPQNVETMVRVLLDQDSTATMSAVLSYTPTPTVTPAPTFTPMPTFTPIPTETPVPYDSSVWLPVVMDSGSSYDYGSSSSGISSGSSSACVIKGNVNERRGTYIYHCPNSPSYADTKINPSQGDRWFCSEEEALAAGFRAPKNAPPCGGF